MEGQAEGSSTVPGTFQDAGMSLHQLEVGPWSQGVPQGTPTPWLSLGWGHRDFLRLSRASRGCLTPRGAGKGHPTPGGTIPLWESFSPPGAQAQTLSVGLFPFSTADPSPPHRDLTAHPGSPHPLPPLNPGTESHPVPKTARNKYKTVGQ